MLLVAGALSGLIAGLVGLAGGIVIVPVLVWLYGPPVIHDAIVVSWFAVLFNSIGATVK
ncbi:MAG: TSUP family transporter, partial [Aquabacterium sp.]|nr:TSUP family transporter [Aquabacterium sp.]